MKSWLNAVAVTAVLLIAAPAMAQQANIEKPSIQIGVGGKTIMGYLPLTIAYEKGFFKKEGLDVTIDDFKGGTQALQAVVGGSVDFVCGAYEHTILTQVRGIDIEVIALQNDSFGVVIGLPPAKATSYKSPKDLKGLKFGVTSPGSSSAVAVDLLMTQAGMSQKDVGIIAVGAGAGAVAAMESAQIDAISNYDPAISILTQKGTIKPIIDTRTDEGLKDLYGGRFAGSAFYVRADFAKSHPNTVQAFANAIADTLKWMNKASTKEIVAAIPESYFGGDKALYAKTLDAYRGMFSKTGRVEKDVAERVLKVQKEVNADVAKADVDLSKTYDNSFIDKAMKR